MPVILSEAKDPVLHLLSNNWILRCAQNDKEAGNDAPD
jgi:hypothetical protein